MLLKQYGHGKMVIDGVEYVINPCFANIAEIGDPKEIINTVKMLQSEDPLDIYCGAFSILQSCCDKDLPVEAFGQYGFDESGKLVKPNAEPEMINDLVVLASHCVLHGICGKVDLVGEGSDDEELSEFDPSEYVDLAVTHFKISYEEASKMTMTQFVRRMRAEYPEAHKKAQEDARVDVEQQELLRYAQDKGIT